MWLLPLIQIPKKIKLETKEEGECSDSSSEEENEITEVNDNKESVSACDTNRNNIEIQDCFRPNSNTSINVLPDDGMIECFTQ